MNRLHASEFGDIEAVILDWAGTSVDFGCHGPMLAVMQSFSALGLEITRDEARAPMGMGQRDHVAAILAMPRIAQIWAELYGEKPSEASAGTVYELMETILLSTVTRHAGPIPGVPEAVAMLRRAGVRIGSCTGYQRPVMEPLMQRAKELGFAPDVTICASDVPHGRPAPDMCKEALRRLGVSNPARAVKIGDTVNDVLEGVRAGMWVIGVTLSGSMAGLSQEELAALPREERQALHQRISHELLLAGAHFTAPDILSCLPLLRNLENTS